MQELEFGPVVISDFFDEDRIGYYDDDSEDEEDNDAAVVFIGDMLLAMHTGHYLIPHACLRPINTDDLFKRREAIGNRIGPALYRTPKSKHPSMKEKYELLLELSYIDSLLMERMFTAQFHADKDNGSKIFVSHSSLDKEFVRALCVDLANSGHKPWLDEWEIKAGESITAKVSEGLQACDYIFVVLSNNSTNSPWVEREWQSKYWSEIDLNKVVVIPVLIEECKVPVLLRDKKYADFRGDYHAGLETLLSALK
jgi:hypothetical protein